MIDPLSLSLAGFAVTMYITPGPNNVMVTTSAANHGVRATMPHMLGINAGFSLMLVLVCGGLGAALLNAPSLLRVMRWVGAVWLVWLAWKIATSPPPGEGGRRPVLGRALPRRARARHPSTAEPPRRPRRPAPAPPARRDAAA